VNDRRRRRSEVPAEAAHLYFQALVERHRLEALTLANDDGLLVAAARREGSTLDLDWIAALGSVCAMPGRRGAPLGALVERVTEGRMLTSTEIELRGEKLYVTAVGGPLPPRAELEAATARILARSLPAAA
jgi:hypothetical protein